MLISYVIYLFVWLKDKERRGSDKLILLIPALIMVHLLLFSLHRTLGGRQFGSRYAADSLPAIYIGMLLILNRLKLTANHILANAVPMLFGLLINFHGTIMFFIWYFPDAIQQWGT
jgi:hypothetical protein